MLRRIGLFTPNLKESWIMFACVVVCGSILALPTTLVPDVHIISTLLAYILTLSPAFIYAYLKVRRGEYTPVHKINEPHFGKLHPAALFLLLPFTLVAFLVATEPASALVTTPEWFDKLMKETALGGNIYWSVITTCICAPILEELLCRGMILRGLKENGASPLKAIFWSSVIFGVIHMNPWQAIPAFLIGMLLGWVYHKTGCIWTTIWMHAVNNSLSTLLYHLFPDIPASATIRDLTGNSQTYLAIYAIALAVLALSYLIISKFIGKRDDKKTVISA